MTEQTVESLIFQRFSEARRSFPFFLTELWRLQGLPPPHRAQLDIADFLQNGPKRCGILGFRGLSKTWITGAFCVWSYLKNVNERVLLSSFSNGHGVKTLGMARRWIKDIPYLHHLEPDRLGKRQRDSASQFDVGPSKLDRVASMTAIGITGQLPGGRASLIVPDDVETDENAMTLEQRQLLVQRFDEFECVVLPEGRIVVLGTYHHEDSLYHVLRERGYEFRAYPVMYPKPTEIVPDLAPCLAADLESGKAKPGDPVWPDRFGHDFIIQKQAGMSPAKFAREFMLRVDLNDDELYPLRCENFIVFEAQRDKAPVSIAWGQSTNHGSTAIEGLPCVGLGGDRFYGPIMVDQEWSSYHGTKAFLDPAGSGTDETAWAIGGQLHGYIYVKHVGAFSRKPHTEDIERIVLLLREYGATELIIEAQFGGETWAMLFEPVIRKYCLRRDSEEAKAAGIPQGWACYVRTAPATGQKEQRIINSIAPVLNSHRVVIHPSVAKDTTLMRQLTRITEVRGSLADLHDDRVEALAGLCKAFEKSMNQDAEILARKKRERDYAELLRKYKHRFAPPAPRWYRL